MILFRKLVSIYRGGSSRAGPAVANDPNKKKRDYFERYDLGKLAEIEAKPIPHWVPPHRMMNVESDKETWRDKWRAGTSNFRTVAELFTKRNLWALATILKEASLFRNGELRSKLLFGFSSMCLFVSKMHQDKLWNWRKITKGTYYIPQTFRI